MSAVAALILAAAAPYFGTVPDPGAVQSPRSVAASRAPVQARILRLVRAVPDQHPGDPRRRVHLRRDGTQSIDFD